MISRMQSFGLLLFLIDTGVHWNNSVRRYSTCHATIDARQASVTTGTSGRNRKAMEIDPTVLG